MAEAQQRNVSKTADEGTPVVKAPEQNAIKLFFQRLRVLGVFFVGFSIGMLSLSVFAKEFSSPTSLRPSTLATNTDQFLVVTEEGNPIIKNHVQATNFVKPAINTVRRMNKTADIPTKADFAVEQKVVKPSALSKTTALFTKNSATSSTSTTSKSGSSTKEKGPDVRVSTPVGVAAIKAPTRTVNITTVMSRNNGTLPTRNFIPLSTTNPMTLISKKPTTERTKKPLPTKKPVASKKGDDKDKDKDDEKKGDAKSDSDEKYTKKLETPDDEKKTTKEDKDRRLRR